VQLSSFCLNLVLVQSHLESNVLRFHSPANAKVISDISVSSDRF
jgi:hypothetical protein